MHTFVGLAVLVGLLELVEPVWQAVLVCPPW